LSDPYDRVDVSEVTPVLTEKEFQEQVRQLAEIIEQVDPDKIEAAIDSLAESE